ncbi:DUF4179 domain-containing protein [Paenibacillus glycinis]|nr:DUF4179 domain-containing protein [Paenibacillus glycinis]
MFTSMEENEFDQLQKMIRETPVHVDFTARIMNRMDNRYEHYKPRAMKRYKAAWIAASLFVLAIALTSIGFVSPTMAESLKKIPGIASIFQAAGDSGLKTADEEGLVRSGSADAHQGVTLQVPVAMFDGTRISIGLNRVISGGKSSASTIREQIKDVDLFVDGEPVQSFSPPNSNSIGVYLYPGMNDDSAIVEFSDLHNQGGKALPDKFNLSMSIAMNGIQAPFLLNVPMERSTRNTRVWEPNRVRSLNNIDFTLMKVESTPITTNLTTTIALSDHARLTLSERSIGIDVFDDKGNKIKFISGNGWNETNGSMLQSDYRFEPLPANVKSITVKPYEHAYQAKDSNLFQLEADGTPVVHYLPELEMTVKLK